ncbi:MAG: hypothetical protein M3R27_16840, partial [Bacteroidota bacterium]|nr:hypothetical protein [Bacteroidota bacterium]
MKHLLLFFLLILGISVQLHAQKDTVIDGKRYTLTEEQTPAMKKNKRHLAPLDSEFVINNKRIKYYNNWLTAGAGVQQNLSYKREPGFAGGLDFNFHIKHHYFQLGAILSGERFGSYNNYQFHLGYGKRHEDRSVHIAGFAGLSYSTGYGKVGDTTY